MQAPTRARRFTGVIPGRESTAVLWVKRLCIAAVAIHMVFSAWSLYRRIRQVIRIDLESSSSVLVAGATVSYDVIASGEVHNRIRLELVQGDHAETLREERTRVNSISAYDPRIFRYERTTTITPEVLSRFAAGPATLRLTGFGSQKLLRTPAPRVRELSVQLVLPR
jgi:hypothetical protein